MNETSRNIYIADLVTTIIVLLGFASILYAPKNITVSCLLITIAGILDSIDGLLARKFQSSDSGLVYDSIADIVSFSLSPSIIVYYYLQSMTLVSVLVSAFLLLSTVIHMRRFMHTEELLGCPTTISALAVCQSVFLNSPYLIIVTVLIFSGAVLRKTSYTKDVDLNIKLIAGLILVVSSVLSYLGFHYDFILQISSIIILTSYSIVGGRVSSISVF